MTGSAQEIPPFVDQNIEMNHVKSEAQLDCSGDNAANMNGSVKFVSQNCGGKRRCLESLQRSVDRQYFDFELDSADSFENWMINHFRSSESQDNFSSLDVERKTKSAISLFLELKVSTEMPACI